MNSSFDMSRFTQKGKMQDAPAGSVVIAPVNAGIRIIPNFVSIEPKFDYKLDIIIDRIWNRVKQDYYAKISDFRNFKLGTIIDSLCASDIFVVSMVVRNKDGVIDATGLETALKNLTNYAKPHKSSLHFSLLLAEEVPPLRDLVKRYCADEGINCYFYAVPKSP